MHSLDTGLVQDTEMFTFSSVIKIKTCITMHNQQKYEKNIISLKLDFVRKLWTALPSSLIVRHVIAQ